MFHVDQRRLQISFGQQLRASCKRPIPKAIQSFYDRAIFAADTTQDCTVGLEFRIRRIDFANDFSDFQSTRRSAHNFGIASVDASISGSKLTDASQQTNLYQVDGAHDCVSSSADSSSASSGVSSSPSIFISLPVGSPSVAGGPPRVAMNRFPFESNAIEVA